MQNSRFRKMFSPVFLPLQTPGLFKFASSFSFFSFTLQDSSLFRKDDTEPWKTPLAYISENSSSDDQLYRSEVIGASSFPQEDNEASNASDQYQNVTSDYFTESPPSSISNTSEKKDFTDFLSSGKSVLEIHASPGPLGLIVRSSDEGPVVCEVSPQSSVAGLVEADDIIVSVNDVDTRSMSTIAFAQYMTNNEQLPGRVITVLRAETIGDPDELMSL